MIILGLTGSIAMGKSTMAQLFRDEGVAVHDADKAVHELMEPGGMAAVPVGEAFPQSRREDGGIDRPALGKLVFSDGEKRQQLEQILHPLVRLERDDWLSRHRDEGAFCVGLDVPLLFETGGEKDCDYTVVASASAFLQRQRALARGGMTAERLDAILELQMPDAMKRDKADFIVPTDYGKTTSRFYVQRNLRQLERTSHA
ncbi:MAG: dephospho-CoA kinase [Alphaproteobacteria bacterium]|nr:dephospho-CoA kinase [Alphaproteobacteria bacterium]